VGQQQGLDALSQLRVAGAGAVEEYGPLRRGHLRGLQEHRLHLLPIDRHGRVLSAG
jgi:hypothetical protein